MCMYLIVFMFNVYDIGVRDKNKKLKKKHGPNPSHHVTSQGMLAIGQWQITTLRMWLGSNFPLGWARKNVVIPAECGIQDEAALVAHYKWPLMSVKPWPSSTLPI